VVAGRIRVVDRNVVVIEIIIAIGKPAEKRIALAQATPLIFTLYVPGAICSRERAGAKAKK